MYLIKSKTTGSYIRDAVFSANDGIITTFAVIAGAQGAQLAASVVIIMGFANLVSDGFSMASGNYLGIKSEEEYDNAHKIFLRKEVHIVLHPLITFGSFVAAGLLPLLPYLVPNDNAFELSIIAMILALVMVGVTRAHFSRKQYLRDSIQTLLMGGTAAFVAYVIGYFLENYVL